MPTIIKVSELRNYSAVLDDVHVGNPVFLTKNGTGRFVLMDIDEYDALKTALWGRLFTDLDASRDTAQEQGWLTDEQLDLALKETAFHE